MYLPYQRLSMNDFDFDSKMSQFNLSSCDPITSTFYFIFLDFIIFQIK